jgi:hypothetical protein
MVCDNTEYTPFRPVYRNGDRLIVQELPLTPELRERVKTVLQFYDVPFKEDQNGDLLIPAQDWQDQELMWNYTTKANDAAWLQTHQRTGDK